MSRIPQLELARFPPASVLHTQLQMHHQMLYRQHNMTHHHHHHRHPAEELTNNGWLLPPTPGAGPTLPGNVSVSLQNAKLWQQFHAETTEMIITKLGRRMFPSLQLQIEGLERRGRYCLLLEVTPASRRRHKYLGGGGVNGGSVNSGRGWTTAGPAEPQPHVNRRVYLHPDSPATGSHWMQHPVSFNKLKLTNNAVDHHSNVVLTSMHKYIPTVWIVRCDDVSRLTLLFTQPASSFCFPETEFIAVTAYQNENITKLKIDNNPFAKGFRETGQSRCKRKMQSFDSSEVDEDHLPHHAGVREEDDEENMSSLESASNPLLPQVFDEDQRQRAKRVASESGSFDDSGVSSSSSLADRISPQFQLNSDNNRKSSATPAPFQPPLHRPWIDHEEENKENAGDDGVATPDSQSHLILQNRHTTVENNQSAWQQYHNHHHHHHQQQQQQYPSFVQPEVHHYTRDVFSPHHHHQQQRQHFSPAVEFARINQHIQNHYQQMHYGQLYCSQISQLQRLKNIAMQFNSPRFTPALTPRCSDLSPPNPILLPFSPRVNKVAIASQFDRHSCPPLSSPPSPSLSSVASIDGSSASS
ncbi:T-box transcription factor TBX20-like [Neodiprion lecontei]|uniref:T-box transcription factor TBX20-like n=1 Tax=Neodiprion lecontei TaxID=441921 RepID=A0ABM3G4U3_NEOLC|nr:T-box transcription factor TBX20-like [Neodiprion lecontei]